MFRALPRCIRDCAVRDAAPGAAHLQLCGLTLAMNLAGSDTLVSRLAACAGAFPDRLAYRFLPDGADGHAMTFGDLDRDARTIAAALQDRFRPGDRVLLVVTDGLHFVRAFFGCLNAGIIAVPSYPPDPRRRNRTETRLRSIARDAGVSAVLVGDASDMPEDLPRTFGAPPVLSVEDLIRGDPAGFRPTAVTPETTAFLQYTSGSTGTPKGVIVSHGNVRHNQDLMKVATGHDEPLRVASWLPLFHDMGLIGAALFPVADGGEATLMPPAAFMRRPARWLQCIDRFKANMGGGPNFGYMLCVQRTSEAIRETLDLSSWRVAFNGAEPIRPDTLLEFQRMFAPCGLRTEAIRPVFGLAECTLMGSGAPPRAELVIKAFDNDALIEGRGEIADDANASIRRLPSCGAGWHGSKVAIVDPETGKRCPDGVVGEIWCGGDSVAQGYWQRPDATRETFGARLAEWGDIPTLRTGDLGFMHDGEIYILGRMKDLIIIRGRNIHPEDVEVTMQTIDPRLRASGGVACSIDIDDEERLVLIQECSRIGEDDAPAILEGIRQVVTTTYDVMPHAIYLVRSGTIPRTSSGKLERKSTRQMVVEDRLSPLFEWTVAALETPQGPTPGSIPEQTPELAAPTRSAHEIETWLRVAVARRTGLTEVDRNTPIAEFGLDSLQSTEMLVELETLTGRPIQTTVLFDHPTIAALAAHLTSVPASVATAVAPSARRDDGIAIVGMSCRFPQADGLEAFWELLINGVDAIREVPGDRWDANAVFSREIRQGRSITRWGGFLDDVRGFDHRFFGIGHREAVQIDPQQRLLLETTWEAMEDAGIPVEHLKGSQTGVYVGISANEYADAYRPGLREIEAHTATGAALSIAANRISYALDLQGPSLAVDTACSSSLVAVHLACDALRNGDCRMAFAGGANMMFRPQLSVNFSQAGVMADDGRCKFLDARANGYVRGEGVGMVALKPLSVARADGDRIYAVIHGSAVMSDGRTNGLMAPSESAQRRVIEQALARSGVRGEEIQAIEAHGTGTRLGDRIEMQALGAALGRDPDSAPVRVGSVKTNFGHLEAAAGIAGLIKLALALDKGVLPPSLHLETPAPDIDLDALRLDPLVAPAPWPETTGQTRRLGGVSAFGFGGTICHAILGAAEPVTEPEVAPDETATGPHLLTLSAASEEGLRALSVAHAEHLAALDEAATALWTAANRTMRSSLTHRLAISAPDRKGLVSTLQAHLAAPNPIARTQKDAARTAFVFAGQGPEWWPLPPDWQDLPEFCETLTEADRHLAEIAGWSLLDVLGDPERRPDLHRPLFAQPALIAVQLAAANLLQRWGVTPDVIIGHSVGEVAAAAHAGCYPLREALRIAHVRGQATETASRDGAMAVLGLTAEATGQALAGRDDGVTISAINSAETTIVSGTRQAITTLVEQLAAEGHFARALEAVNFASHSPAMAAPAEALSRDLGPLDARAPELPLFSTVDVADWTAAPDADYFARNLRQPVMFSPALAALRERGITSFVELSGHPTLVGSIEQDLGATGATATGTLHRETGLRAAMLGTVGTLWSAGHELDWSRIFPDTPTARPKLPRYPWQRAVCWPDAPAGHTIDDGHPRAPAPAHPYLSSMQTPSGEPVGTVTFGVDFDPGKHGYFDDHRVQNQIVVASPALVETAIAAVRAIAPSAAVELRDVDIRRAVVCGTQPPVTELRLDPTGPASWRVRLFTRAATQQATGAGWQLNMSATAHALADAPALTAPGDIDTLATEPLSAADHIASVADRGLQYGPGFRGLERIRLGPGAGRGTLRDPAEIGLGTFAGTAHPALMDASWQILGATAIASGRYDEVGVSFVPVGMDRIRVIGEGNLPLATCARMTEMQDDSFRGDVTIADADGRVFYQVEGLRIRQLELDRQEPTAASCQFTLDWQSTNEDLAPGNAAVNVIAVLDDSAATHDLVEGLRENLTPDATLETITLPSEPPESGAYAPWAADLAARLRGTSGRAPMVLMIAGQETDMDRPAEGATGPGSMLWAVLSLARACCATGAIDRPPLWIVTRGGAAIPNDTTALPDPGQGAVRGAGLDLALDGVVARLVDLDPAEPIGPAAARLAREIASTSAEGQVGYRAGHRLVPRLRPSPPVERPFRPAPGATILITGGLGDIGLEIAAWLVGLGARRLVLTGRRAFDLRNPAESDHAIAARLHALEAEGATILYEQCDVADPDSVAQMRARVGRILPPITGIFHAAGVVRPGALADLSWPDAEAVLRPKLAGAMVLDRAFDHDLECFVLLSSVSSVLGTRWVAPYAAANHALDALAARRRARGRTALSANFGTWGEVGMVTRATDGDRAAMNAAAGLRPMTNALALAALGDAMAHGQGQTVVAALDLAVLRDLMTNRTPFGALLDGLETPADTRPDQGAAERDSDFADALRHDDAATRQQKILDWLGAELGQLSAASPSDPETATVSDYNMDSLMGMQLKMRVNMAMGIDLPIMRLLAEPSLADLSAEIATALMAGDEHDETTTTTTTPAKAVVVMAQGAQVPFSAAQARFLHTPPDDLHHWNCASLPAIEWPGAIDIETLRTAATGVFAAHSGLRLCLGGTPGNWHQTLGAPEAMVSVDTVDIPGTATRHLEDAALRLHASLDPVIGPVMRVGALREPGGPYRHLVFALHHLVADAYSARLVLEDIVTAYLTLGARGEMPSLHTTTPFEEATALLRDHAHSPAMDAEAEFWLAKPWDRVGPLPVDFEDGINAWDAVGRVVLTFDRAETARLMAVARAGGTGMEEVLLAAVGTSIGRWSGAGAVPIELVHHGRQDMVEGVNLARTAGWHNSYYPVLMTGAGDTSLAQRLAHARTELSATPNFGAGFCQLAHLRKDDIAARMRALPEAQVSFNYLARLDSGPSRTFNLTTIPLDDRITRSQASRRKFPLFVLSRVRSECLEIILTYGSDTYRRETIERVGQDLLADLRALAAALEDDPAPAMADGACG